MPMSEILMQLLPSLISAAGSGVGSYYGSKSQQPAAQQYAGQQFGGQQFGGQQFGGQQPDGQIPGITAGQGGQLPGVTFQTGPGGETYSTYNRFAPQQQQMQSQLLGTLGPLLQGLMGQGPGGGAIGEEARTQFHQKMVPSIAERFTSMGQGAQSTEAFKRSLGTAGAGLEQGLASNQQGMMMQLLPMLLQGGMSPQRESFMTPSRPGFGESLFGSLAEGIGTAGPQLGAKYLENKYLGGSKKPEGIKEN